MKTVKTSTLLSEIPTQGHSPLKFLCDDGNIYFCKYRIKAKEVELDCLLYEVVAAQLLFNLNIPTPEIAIVEIAEGSYDINQIKANRNFIAPKIQYFGSKEVIGSDLVTELDKLNTVEDFQSFSNPLDLIRIAVFDLWIGNNDRGKGNAEYTPGVSNNYNLLKSDDNGLIKIVAFDHGFAFEGEPGFRIFNEYFPITTHGKLFGTQFFIDFLQYIERAKLIATIKEFYFRLINLEVSSIVEECFEQIPESWIGNKTVKNKMIAYLTHKKRLEEIEACAIKNSTL